MEVAFKSFAIVQYARVSTFGDEAFFVMSQCLGVWSEDKNETKNSNFSFTATAESAESVELGEIDELVARGKQS